MTVGATQKRNYRLRVNAELKETTQISHPPYNSDRRPTRVVGLGSRLELGDRAARSAARGLRNGTVRARCYVPTRLEGVLVNAVSALVCRKLAGCSSSRRVEKREKVSSGGKRD